MRVAYLVVATLVGLGLTPPVCAQTDGSGAVADSLELAETLAHLGRTEEAREILLSWWARSRDGSTRDRREHASWLRGILTVDPAQARVEFRRLVVEFPRGRYAAPALARIARLAAASGDTADASRAWADLLDDYPDSPDRSAARAWLRGSRSGETTATRGQPAEARTIGDVEAQASDARAAGDHAVQLGAFDSLSRARALVERVRAAGFEPRIVRIPESDLIRVRVGRFESEAEARSLQARVTSEGFEALVVGGATRERPMGEGGGADLPVG